MQYPKKSIKFDSIKDFAAEYLRSVWLQLLFPHVTRCIFLIFMSKRKEKSQPVSTFYVELLNTKGHEVAQLGEALRYSSEGHGFHSRRCH